MDNDDFESSDDMDDEDYRGKGGKIKASAPQHHKRGRPPSTSRTPIRAPGRPLERKQLQAIGSIPQYLPILLTSCSGPEVAPPSAFRFDIKQLIANYSKEKMCS